MATYGAINGIPLSTVSATMLMTLYGRVVDSRSKRPVLDDPKAEEIVAKINPSLLASGQKLLRSLGQFKMRDTLAVHTALRARQYDRYTQEFLSRHPDCTVVSLGCGLDTRFWRVDNGSIHFFDVDLPEVIQLKRTLVEETDRYHMIGCSVLAPAWMDEALAREKPVMVLAEGLFMYLPKADVQTLVQWLGERIKQGQLVAEVVNESYTRGLNAWMLGFKFKYELGLGEWMTYQCGITDSDDMEAWSPHLHLIDDWFYYDEEPEKVGFVRFLGKIPSIRKVQWTVRYEIKE